jgi:hypothetical protein
MKSNGNCHGIILPWMLGSLVALLGILAATQAITNSLATTKNTLKDEENEEYLSSLVQALLLNISRSIDHHPFQILPLVAASSDKYHLPPSVATTMIDDAMFNSLSILKVAASQPFKVSSWNQGNIEACSLRSNQSLGRKTPIRLWLSISVDGSSVWGNRVGTHIPKHQDCIRLYLEPIVSHVLPLQAQAQGHLLLPILGESLYYVDRKKVLRHASLYNNEVIENQPIAQLTEGLQFELTSVENHAELVAIKATITVSPNKPQSLRAHTAIPRQPYFDYLAYWINRR